MSDLTWHVEGLIDEVCDERCKTKMYEKEECRNCALSDLWRKL